MQHQLGWLHALGVEYDSSTFDTDPFEPESDGPQEWLGEEFTAELRKQGVEVQPYDEHKPDGTPVVLGCFLEGSVLHFDRSNAVFH